jgi:hypothetical protein
MWAAIYFLPLSIAKSSNNKQQQNKEIEAYS